MHYKFLMSYVFSAATLLPITAGSHTQHNDDKSVDTDKQITTVMDSINATAFDTVPTLTVTPVQIKQRGSSVVYIYNDGSQVIRNNGTRAWRNNNPGNLRYYDFAKNNGAIGEAGNFAVFPDEETGMQALHNLLLTDSYKNLTIAGALKRYDRTNWQSYTRKLTRLTGLSANAKLCSLTKSQLNEVAQTIRRLEGWVPGNEQQIEASQYAMLQASQQKVR